MNIINKLIKYNPSISDILTYVYVTLQKKISGIWGTQIFKIKAMLFGVKFAGGVKCWGPIHIMRCPKSEITIGRNVSIVSSSKRCTASSIFAPTKLRTLTPDCNRGDQIFFMLHLSIQQTVSYRQQGIGIQSATAFTNRGFRVVVDRTAAKVRFVFDSSKADRTD